MIGLERGRMMKKKKPRETITILLFICLGLIRVGDGFLLHYRISPATAITRTTTTPPRRLVQQQQQHDVFCLAAAAGPWMDEILQVLSSSSSSRSTQQQQQLLDALQDLPLPVVLVAGGIAGLTMVNLLSSLLPAPARLVDEKTLSEIVSGTFLENKKLKCAYKASRDGWSAIDFHNAVDNRGCGVVVAKKAGGGGQAVFGGFNPSGWRSTDDYYTSSTAFLWAKSSSSSSYVSKFPILPGGNAAIFDYATSGPNFGAGDLQIGPPLGAIMGGFAGPDAEDISTSAGNLRTCKASPGMTYGGTSTPKWPVRGTVKLIEVEVYCQPKFLD